MSSENENVSKPELDDGHRSEVRGGREREAAPSRSAEAEGRVERRRRDETRRVRVRGASLLKRLLNISGPIHSCSQVRVSYLTRVPDSYWVGPADEGESVSLSGDPGSYV